MLKKQKTTYRYSTAFRLEILNDISRGVYTISEVSLLYGMSRSTLYQWIHKYGDDHIIAKTIKVRLKGEVEMIKKHEDRIAQLEKLVADLMMQLTCEKAKNEVLEERLGTAQKKSSLSGMLNEPIKK